MATSPLELHMINYLLVSAENGELDDWETEFINSISELPMEKTLTEAQRIKLKEIYDKH